MENTQQDNNATNPSELGDGFVQISREQEVAIRTQAIIEGQGVGDHDDEESDDEMSAQ